MLVSGSKHPSNTDVIISMLKKYKSPRSINTKLLLRSGFQCSSQFSTTSTTRLRQDWEFILPRVDYVEFESASHSVESAVNKLWPINLLMRLSIFPFFRFDLGSNNSCLRRGWSEMHHRLYPNTLSLPIPPADKAISAINWWREFVASDERNLFWIDFTLKKSLSRHRRTLVEIIRFQKLDSNSCNSRIPAEALPLPAAATHSFSDIG